MTKEKILHELQDINTDAANYIYTANYKALNSMVETIYNTGFNREEGFYDTLRAYRLADMPFYTNGYNFICEKLKDEIWDKYEPIIQDLVIHNLSLNDFLNAYGYTNEYDALNNATDNHKKIYNRTIIKRIRLIEDYTTKFNELKKLYENSLVRQIHQTTNNKNILLNRFTNAVAELIKAREQFYYYINYDLIGEDVKTLNKKLKQLTNNRQRIALLKNVTDNIFTTLEKDTIVDFRDFFIIRDNRHVRFTNYLTTRGFSSNSWFDYKRKTNKKFVGKRYFYLQMAFFLALPTSNEIEQFLNYNGYTIKSPFRNFPNTTFYDYDICRYIDAGISFDLINVMLESI